ncbi:MULTISPECIES: HIT family protein [Streptomyces]|uniref:HIT family protein n=1 Tax=Streptomyces TaxID=1883 RepID=UPI002ED6BE6B|nr:HIT domain-containing protein [Streptomyces sp. NBC_00724]
MKTCDFCDIVANPTLARVVYEDAHAVAFFPLAPVTAGHTLVVPRVHAVDLWEMPERTVQQLTHAVLAVGRTLRAVLAPDGMNVINSAGRVASQTVFHVHVHLVPRRVGDAMGDFWPPRESACDEAALDELANRVRAGLRATRR